MKKLETKIVKRSTKKRPVPMMIVMKVPGRIKVTTANRLIRDMTAKLRHTAMAGIPVILVNEGMTVDLVTAPPWAIES